MKICWMTLNFLQFQNSLINWFNLIKDLISFWNIWKGTLVSVGGLYPIKRNVLSFRLISLSTMKETVKVKVTIINSNTVQLRYKRTTHTRIIRAYFAYTRMSIRAHIRVYTCVYTQIYVSLSCIPISFFMWCIVSQTKNIIFLGSENGFKAKFAYF